MIDDKHLKHLGELAVAVGIGLAVAPAGMAVAAPSVGDSSTSSSSDSSDQASSDKTSSDRRSTDRSTDGTSSDRTSSGASGTDSDSASGRSGSSTTGDSNTDSQSTSGTDTHSTAGTESTSSTSNDEANGSGATTLDTGTPPDPTTPDGSSTADGGGMPDPGTTADESGQVGSSSATTAPDTIDVSGAAIAPADRPPAGAVAERSDSSSSSAPAQGHDRAPAGSAVAPNPSTTPVTGSFGTALAPPAMVEGPAMRGPVPAAPAAIPAAVSAVAPAITTIDGTTALARRVSDARADAPQVGTQALAPSLPTPAVDVASSVVSKVLGALGLRPFLSNDPQVPIESPTFWALAAAWCRRQEKAITIDASRALAAAPVTTSEPIESVAGTRTSPVATGKPIESFAVASAASTGTSSASTAGPIVYAPDRGTGTVLGSINASGNQLRYEVTGPPSGGTVTVDGTGGFKYTPTQAARQAASAAALNPAALDPNANYDSFTVTVTDVQSSNQVDVQVQVPVSAARMQEVQSTTVGSNPSGVVFAGTRTYVANQGSKSVSVLDANNAVVGSVPVGTSPTGVAANPAGTRVYVTNSGSGNVSVIDTATNKVVATVTTGTAPNAVAVNPAGTRAYVTNSGSGTVSVIDTATNKVVGTVRVGTAPNAVAVNPAGTRAYVTNSGSGTVSVINTATSTVLATVTTGTTPNAVAVNPTGTRAYVTNSGSNTLSVIDTATNKVVGTVAVGARPTAVRVSYDGSAAYVVTDSDRLWVIDTATAKVVSNVGIDSAPEAGAHSIAMSADGTRWRVTDAVDGRVRALSLTQVNSAPSAASTVGAPSTSDGAVTITLPPDPDGDPVTFTYTTPPSGSVVATGDGAFVFTPTAAARDLARQSEGPDTDTVTFTVRDGQYVTNVDVTVPVTPAPAAGGFDIDSTSIPAGGSPTGAVLVGDRLYVVSEDGFVQVVDRDTNTVVGAPITVDWASSNIAAAPAVDRVYVNSPYTGTISVIDTSTDTVVDTIWLPTSPDYQGYSLAQELAVSPDGTRLYASGEDGTVSVVDTATNTLVTSQSLGYFTDLAVSEDGRHLYGTSGASVTVIDTESMTRTAEVTVGPVWDLTRSSSEFTDIVSSVAVNAVGTRAYATYHVSTVELASGGYSNGQFIVDGTGRLWRVTGGYEVVAVIDVDPSSTTYGTQLATVRLPEGAQDVAISADGDLLYVSGADGRTVSVVDTSTHAVLGTFVTDPDGSTSGSYGPYRILLVDPDTGGTLYVTDYADGAVYAVTGAPGGAPAAVLT
ncbi:Ig-like domain-containing protein [Rhodococcus jostii]|uniref:YVTN family beta-propeller repeat protein n=1 Tax=Rhodococcus jostii TaxID=132919 RepID=UPI003666B5BB